MYYKYNNKQILNYCTSIYVYKVHSYSILYKFIFIIFGLIR